MENFRNMVDIQAVLFVYLLVGVFAWKKKILTEVTLQGLIDFLLNICLPCMIFASFHQSFSGAMMATVGLCLLISILSYVFAWLVGRLLFRDISPGQLSIMRYGTLISNAGFAGLPLIGAAFGQEALLYGSVFLIPMRVCMWTAGISLFTEETDTRSKVRSVLLNPGIIAVALGLIRLLLQVPLPDFFDRAVEGLGSTTTAISFVAIGAILGQSDPRTVITRNVLYLCLVRLVLLPVALLIPLKLLGVDPILTATCVVLVGMPVGTTASLLAKKYGADYVFGSRCVAVSTLFSLVTVPVLVLFV